MNYSRTELDRRLLEDAAAMLGPELMARLQQRCGDDVVIATFEAAARRPWPVYTPRGEMHNAVQEALCLAAERILNS